MKIKAIITGTGRCGTLWASRFLTINGLSCSHEGFFNYDDPQTVWDRVNGILPPTESGISKQNGAILIEREADASYMAMPYLSDPRLAEIPVLHLVRHPLDVISSFVLDLGYFGGEKPHDYFPVWEEWISQHWKSVSPNPATNAADYYIHWNTRIAENAKVYKRIRVEDGIDEETLDFLGASDFGNQAITHSNSFRNRRKRKPIQWSEIEDPQRTQLMMMANQYGYRTRKIF